MGIDLTPVQMENVAAWLGNLGFMLMMVGWGVAFVRRGLKIHKDVAAQVDNR